MAFIPGKSPTMVIRGPGKKSAFNGVQVGSLYASPARNMVVAGGGVARLFATPLLHYE